MKKNVRLMVLAILVLFAMPLVVNAEPLESFAENPIPYWDDDSVDVDVTWSEEQQTVDFNLSIPYWEDFSDVGDWINKTVMEYSSNGDIMTIEDDSAGGSGWNILYTDVSFVSFTGYVKCRSTVNTTVGSHLIRLFEGAAATGSFVQSYLSEIVGVWSIDEFYVENVNFESVVVYYSGTIGVNIKREYDYLLIYPDNGTLDVGVPLEPDSTQSIEFMGNFSTLNSTVRFGMYDNTTASGLFCDVNSSQVTFPDDAYAEFTDVARINFSLDEERIIFKIYVFAQNTTLINYYSDYVGLANKDYLRMNDSVFEGSYELWYLQGDLGYLAEVIDTDNIFYLLFLSTEMWGYIGPIALVIIGYFVFKKDRILGILFFVVECLFIANYIALVSVTPDYWWHIVILLFGGLFTCVFPLWDR